MEMYSPTAIEQARRTTEGSADAHDAENQGDVRDQAVVDAEHRRARRAALDADGELDLLGHTFDARRAAGGGVARLWIRAVHVVPPGVRFAPRQSETVVPSRADCAAASTTARARTPSAAGTGFAARPAHASRNACSSSRSGSSRRVGSSSFPVSTASHASPRLRCVPRWRVTTELP